VEAPESTFDLRVETRDDETVVVLIGDLDLAARQPVEAALDRLRPFTTAVAVDLTAVTFIDSSGLLVLVRLCKEVDDAGQAFRVAGISDSADRLFEVAGVKPYLGVD
jgi:anti-anti-sigma factor